MSINELDFVFAIGGIFLFLTIIALGLAARWIAKREDARQVLQSPQPISKLNEHGYPATQAEAQHAFSQELVARAQSRRPHSDMESNKEHTVTV